MNQLVKDPVDERKKLEQAPPYLQQEFKIIRDLDEQVQSITAEAAARTNELLRIAKSISKDERVKRLAEIQNLYQIAEELSNDKVSRAESIYELVDRQIQRLDADMMEFKKASVVKTMKKSRKKALSIANVKMPASAAFVLALTNDPKNITDMPIDPNEPTYCICGDVSYGEMVACDNKNCPIEWFHFGCVGLTSKPKELEQAPPYLQQEFKIIRDLDEQVQSITAEAAARTNELLRIAKSISKDERVKRLAEIQNLYQIAEELSNDKVSRAESIYELVDRQIQRLDADMMEFKKASVVKTMKKSRKKALSIANVKMPASAAFVLALTNDPKNITDMPIDPNEPTYCICGDVSYGEMVACDNKNCPIEWFHFGCVGLTSKPKGAWSHSKLGVNAPFKSPLRSANEESKGTPKSSKPTISTLNLDDSVVSGRGTPVKNFVASSLLSPSSENEQELDKSTADLMSQICEIRNLESFTTEDIEKEMKSWRDLLHEYNDTKDVCLYIFGQLAQLKMTTVKELFKEHNLDLDD
nr:hypothetical transcript [Hymenolepis microstoma]